MPTIVDCPSCGRKLRVSEELLNRLVECPSCSTRFTAEAGRTQAESVQSAEPPPQAAPPAVANHGEGRAPASLADYNEEEDDRPWEQPGQIRRDAVSHRGHVVLTLGIIGAVLSVLGIPALFCGFCCPPVGIAGGLISLPFTIAAWVMGHSDLKKMRNNVMDPRGRGITRAGWICGIVGTVLGLISTLVTVAWWAFILIFQATGGAITTPAPPTKPTRPTTNKKVSLPWLPGRTVDYLPYSGYSGVLR